MSSATNAPTTGFVIIPLERTGTGDGRLFNREHIRNDVSVHNGTEGRKTRALACVDERMVDMRMIAIALLAAGVLALVYGGFSYTRQTHDAKVGPLEISISEKQRVNVPVWAGVVLVAVGAGLLFTRKK